MLVRTKAHEQVRLPDVRAALEVCGDEGILRTKPLIQGALGDLGAFGDEIDARATDASSVKQLSAAPSSPLWRPSSPVRSSSGKALGLQTPQSSEPSTSGADDLSEASQHSWVGTLSQGVTTLRA